MIPKTTLSKSFTCVISQESYATINPDDESWKPECQDCCQNTDEERMLPDRLVPDVDSQCNKENIISQHGRVER